MPTTPSPVGAVAVFMAAVLGLSWLRFVPTLLERNVAIMLPEIVGDLALPALASFGPLLVAVVLTWHQLGRIGPRRLIGEGLRWRVRPGWFAVALVGPGLLYGIAVLALPLAGLETPAIGLQQLGGAAAIFAAAFIFALGEEYGWRGYLQRRLQHRWSAFVSALVIGVVWTSWHAPLFVEQDQVQSRIPPLPYGVLLVGLSVLFGWIYNATDGSVLLVALAHAAFNAFVGSITLNLTAEQMALFIPVCAAVTWAAGLVVLAHTRVRDRPHGPTSA